MSRKIKLKYFVTYITLNKTFDVRCGETFPDHLYVKGKPLLVEVASYDKEEVANAVRDICNQNVNVFENSLQILRKTIDDGIYYQGKFLPMEYEELVDLLAHYRDSGKEENKVLTREKCANAFGSVIPMSNY